MNSLVKKAKVRLRDSAKFGLIKLSVLFNQPKLTAWLFAKYASRLGQSNDYRVLVMGRSIFNDDIRAMVRFSNQIEYQIIHLSFWQVIFDHFVSKADRDKITESNYHNVQAGLAGRQKYHDYLLKMFPVLRNKLGFQAVISGNIGYIAQQELAKICLTKDVAFVVLHKEAVVVSQAYHNFLNVYKHHHFVGHKVMFYNEQCMKGLLDLNIPGLTADKAVYAGIPRFDYYFHQETKEPKKQIVLFSFLPRYSTRFLTDNEESLSKLEQRGVEFFQAVFTFAADHPEINFIVKTKMAPQYVDFPTKILQSQFPEGLSNVSIVNTGDPSKMINESMAVIGFNSTTLIEALIAGKPIVSPDFGDILTDRDWSFFQHYPELVNYVKSKGDLEQVIFNKGDDLGYSEDTKKAFLQEYISTASGGASTKVESVIIDTIKSLSNS